MSEEKYRASNDIEMISRTDKDEENQFKNEDIMMMTHSETPMLEDEEMPTYISVSTSSKCEDSDINNTKQHDEESPTKEQPRSPCTSEQGGTSSVYLLSSGEDTDPRYNDEDDGEYGDSDDMEDIDLESEHDNAILEEEEEDEDEMEDEDNEDEYKRNCFDTASDCVGVKRKLKKSYKDKSLSLQDLSICQNNIRDPDLGRRHRYRHVESKVKRYINDIKEQNRCSLERRLKDQERARSTEHMEEKDCTNFTGTDLEQVKSTKTNKVIKDYAERAIKDLEIEETYTNNKNIYMTQITENGEVVNKPLIDCIHKQDTRSIEMDVREKEFVNTEEKNKKRNGSVQNNMLNHTYSQATLVRNMKMASQNEPLVNGHQLTLFNLRTLTYDEYMHGNANYYQDAQLNKNMHIEQHENNDIQTYSEVDVMNAAETDNSNAPCSLKIENVKSIRVISEESKDNTDNLKFEKLNEEINKNNFESMQITLLKTQLDQKTVQFNNLKDAYQNTLAENLKMKQELEELKMSLAKYDKEHRARETKVVAVQTDTIASVPRQNETAGTKETGNKVSTSSIASVASSINQWTDSAGSSSISMKPPDLGTILNSEDSLIMTDDTPRKMNRPFSRAFITSSRILRTLSSITQGKSKSEIKSNSPSVSSKKKLNGNEESEHVKENDGSIIAGSNVFTINSPSNTKKRKATEMLGSSTFLQPSKIPHTAELKRKSSTTSDYKGDFKSPENYNEIRVDTQKNRINNINFAASPATIEDNNDKNEDIEKEENDVKCFIYREDENIENRSILIQAEIPNDDQETVNTGCIRECGPYLLGNVEVRMSEVNGTINIWGKEVSQTSSVDDDDDDDDEEEEEQEEMEIPTRSVCVNNRCTCLQNTPHRKFNGSKIVCSTNKKEKMPPKFNDDHNCQYLHVPDRSSAKIHIDNVLSPSISASCGKCISLNHHKECLIDKRHTNLHEKSHSCCVHHIEHLERDYKYACDCERRRNNNDSPCCAKGFCTETIKMFPPRNMSDFRKDLYSIINPTVDAKEVICKHRTMCRRSSLHNTEGNFQNDMKCCNTIRETSHTCKSTLGNMGNQDISVEHFCNHSPTSNEDDPLIPERGSSETPETRQRRSSGKRVRGILKDLLKSCGDYRNSSTSSSKKCTSGKETSRSVNCSPQINVTSCNSPDAGCSNSQQSAGRCCQVYARRIESQLEEFRREMERVRTRSDAILNLINMLHSVEMN